MRIHYGPLPILDVYKRQEDSFANISAYGANAALPHYSAIPGEDAELQPRGDVYKRQISNYYTPGQDKPYPRYRDGK